MLVLVTGAAGFIGSTLVERLLADGHSVIGVDDLCDFYDPARKQANLAAALRHPAFRFSRCDIRDAEGLADACDGPLDAIVHLAAWAGVRPSLERPALYADVNVRGTVNVLELAVAKSVGRLLFASSSSVYGNTKTYPFHEDDRVSEPISPYAATKLAGEMLCHTFHHVYGLPISCLRFFTVFGPRQRPDLAISKFLRRVGEGTAIPVFGDGSTSRDYTYIDDIVDGIVASLADAEPFRIVNLGNNRPGTLAELIGIIEDVVGKQAIIDRQPLQDGDMLRTCADIGHAQTALGYAPQVTLESGIAKQWEWMQRES
jgi:UDP-glucuronate 4-epimerase